MIVRLDGGGVGGGPRLALANELPVCCEFRDTERWISSVLLVAATAGGGGGGARCRRSAFSAATRSCSFDLSIM